MVGITLRQEVTDVEHCGLPGTGRHGHLLRRPAVTLGRLVVDHRVTRGGILVAFGLLLVGCGSSPGAPAGSPGASANPGGQGGPGAPQVPGVTNPLDLLPVPTGALMPTTDPAIASVTVDVRGQTVAYAVVVECDISPDSIAIGAANDRGTGGANVAWSSDAPADSFVQVSESASVDGYVLSRDFDGATLPAVSVNGDEAQITALVKEQAFGNRDPETVTIHATCHAPPEVTAPPPTAPAFAGHATVQIGGKTYEFSNPDTCSVSPNLISGQFFADEQTSLSITVMGTSAAFMNVTLPDANWSAGLDVPMQFEVNGTSATWSGTVTDNLSGTQAHATVDLECAS
jgi:hypothetical protein